jgi:3-oxoacyl-[acyl-carrier protein] reductase
MKLEGAVAVITGASRGIGRATAELLHSRGARVGLVARNAADLDEVAARLGDRVAVARADVTEQSDAEAAIARLTDALGPVDVLVNNAGIGAYASVLEEAPGVFERLIRVNYLGTVYATRAALPGMARRGHGHIVNVASIAGRVGPPFEAAYAGSKFAVVGFSESLAAEMQAFGVRVSLVNPGPVHTGFTDARGVPFQRAHPRPLDATRVAAAIERAITRGTFEQILPRWLTLGAVTRALVPGLYLKGLLRDSRRESAALRERFEQGLR